MTSLDLAAIVRELSGRIVGCFVDNVYQLDDGSILLKLRGPEGGLSLIGDVMGRLSLTQAEYSKPKKPPAFCSLLRSRVRGGRVVGVRQLGDDRVVELEVRARGEVYRVIFEFVRGFNVILVDKEGVIVGCLHPKRMRDRSLVPKEAYRPPPTRGLSPSSASLEEFLEALQRAGGKLAGALVRGLNLAGEVAEEVCERAGLSKDLKVEELSREEASRLFEEVKRLLAEVREGALTPHVLAVDGKPTTVLPLIFRSLKGEVRPYPSFNEAVDAYFVLLRAEKEAEAKEESLEKRIKQLEEVIGQQRAKVEALRREAEAKRKAAEALMSKLPFVEEVLTKLREELKVGGSQRVMDLVSRGLLRPIVAVDLSSKKAYAELEGLRAELSLELSAAQNASRLYEEAKEDERKATSAEKVLERTMEELEKVRAGIVKIEEAKRRVEEPRPKPWYYKFRWFISSDGLLVVAGRDASQNEVLVRRYMEPNDIFVHAEVHGAPAVVIKGAGPNPPEATVKEAAQFAVSYSRAWREGRLLADAYWVLPSQVSKTPPSGQYLAKGAFMVRGERNYVRGLPLQVAVGVNEEGELMAGPPSAVAKRSKRYVVLVPGELSSSKLAKEVVKGLGLNDSWVNEVQRLTPPGGRILRVVKV
ncbi:MAG: hypothetical protein DRJ97_00895 [Thermoprotei archaeon]|nr:MAG: hypothetical protein DRJ97_00895 [Thermoprotei archaeon]